MEIWLQRLEGSKGLWHSPSGESVWLGSMLPAAVLMLGLAAVWGVSGVRIALTDIREHRIPRAVVLPARACSLGLIAALAALLREPRLLVSALVGALGYWLLLYALYRAHPAGLGRGDVNYASLLGLIAGATGWAHPWLSAVFAVVLGGCWATVLVLTRRAGPGTHLPFGPFMFAGSAAALLLS